MRRWLSWRRPWTHFLQLFARWTSTSCWFSWLCRGMTLLKWWRSSSCTRTCASTTGTTCSRRYGVRTLCLSDLSLMFVDKVYCLLTSQAIPYPVTSYYHEIVIRSQLLNNDFGISRDHIIFWLQRSIFIFPVSKGSGNSYYSIYSAFFYHTSCSLNSPLLSWIIWLMVMWKILCFPFWCNYTSCITCICNVNFGLSYKSYACSTSCLIGNISSTYCYPTATVFLVYYS